MGALKNVGEVVGAITDVVIDALAEPDYETGRPEPAEKHGFVVEEPKVNDFGRLLVWYHCGIRNTGSVCKNCGEYRRDRTVLDDEAAPAATAATGATQYGQSADVSRSALDSAHNPSSRVSVCESDAGLHCIPTLASS